MHLHLKAPKTQLRRAENTLNALETQGPSAWDRRRVQERAAGEVHGPDRIRRHHHDLVRGHAEPLDPTAVPAHVSCGEKYTELLRRTLLSPWIQHLVHVLPW